MSPAFAATSEKACERRVREIDLEQGRASAAGALGRGKHILVLSRFFFGEDVNYDNLLYLCASPVLAEARGSKEVQ